MTALPPAAFRREDESADALFYAQPRLVAHIDDAAIAALRAAYAVRLRPGDAVLDLMSSWISHLPEASDPGPDPGPALGPVIGHGMNAAELAANPRLDRFFVQDLNRDPILPLDDGSLDAALCCVGIQYLRRPVEVFRDLRRILRPGGRVLVSFSNRCFPTKAVALWLAAGMRDRAAYVRHVLGEASFPSPTASVLADGSEGDPLVLVEAALPA